MLDAIKRLREMTSLGIQDCKKALKESGGDFDKALSILKKRGIEVLRSKQDRRVSQGLVDAYIHFGGNLGALVEVNCETDFVARTEVFKKFVRDLAMQVAALNPKYVCREDIPKDELLKIENIDEYAKEHCILEQLFVKDNTMTVQDYLNSVVSQTGENIVIKRFVRFYLGE